MDRDLMAMCGAYCGACEWKEPYHCKGCKALKGDMFWGTCAIAACCMEKGYEHCGYCKEMPCQTITALFDDKDHGDHGARRNNLKNWANGLYSFEKLR